LEPRRPAGWTHSVFGPISFPGRSARWGSSIALVWHACMHASIGRSVDRSIGRSNAIVTSNRVGPKEEPIQVFCKLSRLRHSCPVQVHRARLIFATAKTTDLWLRSEPKVLETPANRQDLFQESINMRIFHGLCCESKSFAVFVWVMKSIMTCSDPRTDLVVGWMLQHAP